MEETVLIGFVYLKAIEAPDGEFVVFGHLFGEGPETMCTAELAELLCVRKSWFGDQTSLGCT